jgi:hypothetical protein
MFLTVHIIQHYIPMNYTLIIIPLIGLVVLVVVVVVVVVVGETACDKDVTSDYSG